MNDRVIDILLQPLLEYFRNTLDTARNLVHTQYLSDITYNYYQEDMGLAEFIISSINQHRKCVIADDLKSQTLFFELLKKKLKRLFDQTDHITDKYEFNLTVYRRDSVKYNYDGYLKEIGGLVELWGEKMDLVDLQNHYMAVSHFKQGGYNPRRNFKLPFLSDIKEIELFIVCRDLIDNGYFDSFIKHAFENDWSIAPIEIHPHLNRILAYDIGSIKSQVLWDILGYVLLELHELQNKLIYFEDLFVEPRAYDYILKLFKSKYIIDIDGSYRGLSVDNRFENGTVASFLAISEVLTNKLYVKRHYSRSEQVRAMGRTFNKKVSPAAESKKSKDHDGLVSWLYEIIPISYPLLH